MKVRFQADNDLDERIVVATKRLDLAMDFQTANDLGLHGVPDPGVLSLAAQEGRVIVSHDRRTLPRHFGIHRKPYLAWSHNRVSKAENRYCGGTPALTLGCERSGRICERSL